MWLRSIVWLINMEKCDYYIHECSFTVAEGKDSIEHINRLITSNIKLISNLESVETLVCNANGRITDSLQILRIEEQLLLLGNPEVAENTRKLIVSGIHWNEDVRIMNGDMILSKVSLIGSEENLQKVIPKKDIELNENKWIIWEEKYFKKTSYGETSKIDIILETNMTDVKSISKYFKGCSILRIFYINYLFIFKIFM